MRTAIFKPANALAGMLLQEAANDIDAADIPKPGEESKGREPLLVFPVPETVLLIDGATGLEKLSCECFPDADQIVDFFHALEHLQTRMVRS